MKLQVLVSCMQQEVAALAGRMGLETDAVVINQTDYFDYEELQQQGHKIRCYSLVERGVGLSRNTALQRATGDILLFADEVIRYDAGYGRRVLEAFQEHPEADMLLFNIRVGRERATYYTRHFHRVHLWNCGRYPTYSFALRRGAWQASHLAFSLLFGGGAKYSNGEDSLFLKDCIRYGMRVYAVPVELGEEQVRKSTWFEGYTPKFFVDRGVLYHFLYGPLAKPLAMRFLLAHEKVMCQEIPRKNAYALMKKGIAEAKTIR